MLDPARYAYLHLHPSDDGAVISLRLHHGKANEVGTAVLDELDRLAEDLAADVDARALITWSDRRSSRGTPLFVAGADVTERVGWSDDDVAAHVRRQRATLRALRHAPVFHVAVAGGVAFGWGTEYLLTADWAIATDGARFALPETGLGIVPGAGGSSEMWMQIGVRQTLRLGMTGEAIDAEHAARIGLVDEHIPSHEDALVRAHALAARAATRSPTANAAFKQAVLASLGAEATARAAAEDAAYVHCLRTGEAAIGRAAFQARDDGPAPWGPRRPLAD